MIQDVDASLRTLLRREVLDGADVELAFDAPTRDWATRRTAPTIDLYLYDIREDPRLRANGAIAQRADDGRTIEGHRPPPRWFKLSYLVTAWTQRPEDEHRLLAAVLVCFLQSDSLPRDVLQGQLADQREPVMFTIAKPPPDDRLVSEIWSSLGGDLKPSLDLCITAAFDTHRFRPAGPPVLEPTRVRWGDMPVEDDLSGVP